MIGIFAGNYLGFNRQAWSLGNGHALPGMRDQARLNLTNGNLVLQSQDAYLQSLGLDVPVLRTYNSQAQTGANSWQFAFNRHLGQLQGELNQAGSLLTRSNASGHQSKYIYDGGRQCYVNQEQSKDTLKFERGQWHWQNVEHNLHEFYDEHGRLQSAVDQAGNVNKFQYNEAGLLSQICDQSGEITRLSYDQNQQITDIELIVAGQCLKAIHYDYDQLNRLSSVSFQLNAEQKYEEHYTYVGTSNLLQTVSDSTGHSLSFSYQAIDGQHKLSAIHDGAGRLLQSFEYIAGKTIVRDAHGLVATYYYDADHNITLIEQNTTDGNRQITQSYNADGQLIERNDGLKVWHYQYNDAGLLTLEYSNSGLAKTYTYDQDHHCTSISHGFMRDGIFLADDCSYSLYDAQGFLRYSISATGEVIAYQYIDGLLREQYKYYSASFSTDKEPTLALLDAWTRTQEAQHTSYEYDARGQLSRRILHGQTDQITHLLYDAYGHLLAQLQEDEQGQLSGQRYTYDGLGRVLTETDASGNVTIHSYDDRAHLQVIHHANGLVETHYYDANGVLLRTERSAANQQQIERNFYDSNHRLIAAEDALGHKTFYWYDTDGKLLATANSDGHLQRHFYNAQGLLSRTVDYAQAIDSKRLLAKLQQQSGISDWPELAEILPLASAADRQQLNFYDADERLQYQIDAEGFVTQYRYDAHGNCIEQIAYAKAITDAAHFTEAQLQTNVADRHVLRQYDADNHLRYQQDADGYLTEFKYDATGHLIAKYQYAQAVSQALTPPPSSAQDLCERWFYNEQGQLAAHLATNGKLTEYNYDVRGNCIRTTEYAQAVDPFSADNLSRLRPMADSNDHIIEQDFDEQNRLQARKNSNGLQEFFSYDVDGNLIESRRVDQAHQQQRAITQRFDLFGLLIASIDAQTQVELQRIVDDTQLSDAERQQQIAALWQNRATRYEYNQANQLIRKTTAGGATTHYIYDHLGRKVLDINAEGELKSYEYSAFNELVLQRTYSQRLEDSSLITAANGQLTTAVDEQLAQLQQAKDYLTVSTYDKRSLQLRQTNNGLSTSFSYDAFAQMITKNIAERGQRFDYDHRGNLLSEEQFGQDLAVSKHFTYDAFARLTSQTDAVGHRQYYQYSLGGREVVLTDALGAKKITSYDVFGRVVRTQQGKHWQENLYLDADNAIVHQTATGISARVEMNSFGEKISFTDGKQQLTEYHYDQNGQLLQQINADGSALSQTYTLDGLLATRTDADGRVIHYQYDAAGRRLKEIVDPEGLALTTAYEYDALGHRVKQYIAYATDDQRVTAYQFDAQGRLYRQIQDPEHLAITKQYLYNEHGDCVKQQVGTLVADKLQIESETDFQFNGLGQLISKTLAPDDLDIIDQYEYDNLGNLRQHTDAEGNVTQYLYDANNQLRFKLNAEQALTEYQYDEYGNQIKQLRYADEYLTTDFDLKHIEQFCQQAQTKRISQSFFDSDNRLQYQLDEYGLLTTYVYDANNNLIQSAKIAYQFEVGTASSDVIEQVLVSTREDDRTSYTLYDKLNRISYQINAQGNVHHFEYDLAGNIISDIDYAHQMTDREIATMVSTGRLPDFERDSLYNRYRYYEYDQANRRQYAIAADGGVTAYRYNACGELSTETRYVNRKKDELSLADFLIAEQQSFGNVHIHRLYDGAGRLQQEWRAKSDLHQYHYDARGLLLDDTDSRGVSHHQTYDAAGRILAKQTQVAGQELSLPVTTFVYDKTGNLLRKTEDANGLARVTNFAYDDLGQLQSTTLASVAVDGAEQVTALTQTRQYNLFGECITKTDAAGAQLHYVYDDHGRLLYELDQEGYVTAHEYNVFGDKTKDVRFAQRHSRAELASLQVSADDRVLEYQYNKDHTVSAVRQPAVQVLNSNGQLVTASKFEKYFYNSYGNRIRIETQTLDGQWLIERQYFDRAGNLSGIITNQHQLTEHQYNALGQRIQTQDFVNLCHSANDRYYFRPVEANDSLEHNALAGVDRVVNYEYDIQGRLIAEIYKHIRNTRYPDKLKDEVTYEFADLKKTKEYDAAGNVIATETLLRVEDGTGTHTWQSTGDRQYYYYNSLNQLTAHVGVKTDAGRSLTTYSYDALGHQLSARQYANGVTNANAQFYEEVAQDAQHDALTHHEYNLLGQLIASTDAEGHRTEYSYNRSGEVSLVKQQQTNNNGQVQDLIKRYEYDACGQQTAVHTLLFDGSEKIERSEYNAFGEVVAKYIDGTAIAHYQYNNAGQLTRQWQQNKSTIFVYNNLGHLQLRLQPGCETDALDLAQLVAQAKDYNAQWFKTDSLGNTVEVTQLSANGHNVSRQQLFDRWGNVIRVTESTGAQTEYYYDVSNQLYRQDRLDLTDTKYTGETAKHRASTFYYYDAFGHCVAQTNPRQTLLAHDSSEPSALQRFMFYNRYDAAGNLVWHRQDGGITQYEYDLFGLCRAKTWDVDQSRQGTETYSYDRLGQMTELNAKHNHQLFHYDEQGHRVKVEQVLERGHLVTTYEFDASGNISIIHAPDKTMAYQYNHLGLKTAETFVSTGTSYTQSWTYDAVGLLQQHTDLAGRIFTYQFNAQGQLLSSSQADSTDLRMEYNYFSNGAVQSITEHTTAGDRITQYAYDDLGNLAHESFTIGQKNYQDAYYQYDSFNRLIQISDHTNHFDIHYGYDLADNRTLTRVERDGQSLYNLSFEYDLQNRILHRHSEHGTEDFAYDLMGNRINDAGMQMHFDTDGLLLKQGANGEYGQFSYDAMGRVIEQVNGNNRRSRVYNQLTGQLDQEDTYRSGRHETHLAYQYDEFGNQISYTLEAFANGNAKGYTNRYTKTYAHFDGFVVKREEGVNLDDHKVFLDGTTNYIYDEAGRLIRTEDVKDGQHSQRFILNGRGQIIHQAGGKTEADYFYQDGKTIGKIVTQDDQQTIDFDYQYQEISTGSAAATPSSYVVSAQDVQAGKSALANIALSVFGDKSLWYLIADANGLTADSKLIEGQSLIIPSRAPSNHNSIDTFKPYNAGEIIGDLTPTMPLAPPPPPPHHGHHCGGFATVLVVAVAVVATVLTAGAAAAAMGVGASGFSGLMAAGASALAGGASIAGVGMGTGLAVGAAAIGGALGNLASQGVAVATGMQGKIDWGTVGTSGVMAGIASATAAGTSSLIKPDTVTQGANLANNAGTKLSLGKTVLRTMTINAANQVANIGINNQHGFNWRAFAASVASAGVNHQFQGTEFGQQLEQVLPYADDTLNSIGEQAYINHGNLNAESMIGQSLGNMVVEHFKANAEAEYQLRREAEEARSDQILKFAATQQIAGNSGNDTLADHAGDLLFDRPEYSEGRKRTELLEKLTKVIASEAYGIQSNTNEMSAEDYIVDPDVPSYAEIYDTTPGDPAPSGYTWKEFKDDVWHVATPFLYSPIGEEVMLAEQGLMKLYQGGVRGYEAVTGFFVSKTAETGLLVGSDISRVSAEIGLVDSPQAISKMVEVSHPLDGMTTQEVIATANEIGLNTMKDTMVLWSGLGKGSEGVKLAQEYVAKYGGTTLEMTPGGAWLDSMKLFESESPFTLKEAAHIWSETSKLFTRQASGQVRSLIGQVRPQSIYMSQEIFELEMNKMVTGIDELYLRPRFEAVLR